MAGLGALAALAAGCSTPNAAGPYPETCFPLEPVVWSPAGFSVGAPTDVTIRVQFDDYPDPETVRSDSLLLTTGFFWVPASYGVDLSARTATLRPWSPLSPNLAYSIHLTPALTSLSGCPAPRTIREFTTGSGPASTPLPEIPSFSEVQAIFDRRCAGGCHLAGGGDDPSSNAEGGGGDAGTGDCLDRPAAALSLCAAESWDALVGVPSRQDETLLRVRPGSAASSYLLRKLLTATSGDGPPPPTLGHRDPPGTPLEDGEIAAVAAWIDGGARR